MPPVVLKPARVWDGFALDAHDGWIVVVRGETIEAAGPAGEVKVPEDARTIDLPGTTLLPGLIDAHTHVLLHPYDEAPGTIKFSRKHWHSGFVVRPIICEAPAFRVHHDPRPGDGRGRLCRRRAQAGRRQGIIPGPRMLVVTRAIVATGSYAPKGFAPEFHIPQGAEEADGADSLIRVVRDQIGKGADWIKVYADTAMGGAAVRPSFSVEELTRIVETARSVGVLVSAHATSKEGMRRASLGRRCDHRAWRRWRS